MVNLIDLPLADLVLATGALGLAAAGVVEGLKAWDWLGLKGYERIKETLGTELMSTMEEAYGKNYESLLKAQYRSRDGRDELVSNLRQGVRLGLTPMNARSIAEEVGVVDPKELREIAKKIRDGEKLEDKETSLLGRFELAADTKIDAAITLAESTYQASMRNHAFVASILIAILAAFGLVETPWDEITTIAGFQNIVTSISWTLVFIVGVAAVPLAPVAKDLSTALRAAATAIRGRK